jgi:transcriptional regulator with XRE-family HTH domain
MENEFGNRIRELRESKQLLQRQVASLLEIDTPMLSKIERGERKAKKEQVKQFADIYRVTIEELLTLWLADQVYEMVKDEKVADNALKSVSKNIKSNKRIK